MKTTRRQFLAGAAACVPWVRGLQSPGRPGAGGRSLVVVELNGGNDGLNTVCPAEDPRYRRARPTLRLDPKQAAGLGGGLFLHPSLAKLARWFERGKAAALMGVGYPDPDRSHFRSLDIWHSGSTAAGDPTHGWLGLAADQLAAAGVATPALALGTLRVPLALLARRLTVPSLRALEDYQVLVDRSLGARSQRRRERIARVPPGTGSEEDSLADHLARTAQAAYDSAERLREAVAAYRPAAEFPDTGLGRGLALAARVLASRFGARIFHVAQGGYDTHAAQAGTHALLLADLADSLDAFLRDLEAYGLLDETLVLTFSEFGRRLAENASKGTDHGAAGPMLAFSGRVRPGIHGGPPDLADLDSGDVRSTMDFRSVYASVLEDWLAVDARAVLGGDFAKAAFLA
jgi:uncharacterized protein (DUF1501 family)